MKIAFSGTTVWNDGAFAKVHPSLVPKQTLQGKKAKDDTRMCVCLQWPGTGLSFDSKSDWTLFPHPGAIGWDDWAFTAGNQSLVPESPLQGQKASGQTEGPPRTTGWYNIFTHTFIPLFPFLSAPQEQLCEMSGLSPRVVRVWFQNKRCKDKKRAILMKQMQQQQEKVGTFLPVFAKQHFLTYGK